MQANTDKPIAGRDPLLERVAAYAAANAAYNTLAVGDQSNAELTALADRTYVEPLRALEASPPPTSLEGCVAAIDLIIEEDGTSVSYGNHVLGLVAQFLRDTYHSVKVGIGGSATEPPKPAVASEPVAWSPPTVPDVERSVEDLIRERRLLEAETAVTRVRFEHSDAETNRHLDPVDDRIVEIEEELAQRRPTTPDDARDLLDMALDRFENDGDPPERFFTIAKNVRLWISGIDRPVAAAAMAHADAERQRKRQVFASAGA